MSAGITDESIGAGNPHRLRSMLVVCGTWLKVAWLMVGLTLLYFVVLNVAAKLALMAVGEQPVDRVFLKTVLTDAYGNAPWIEDYVKSDSLLRPRWHPYVYFLPAPLRTKYINIDDAGLRSTWNQAEAKHHSGKRPVRIFMFGGSTMWGYGARDDYTIPSRLSAILARRGIKDVEVTNFGQIGYVSTQEALALFEQLREDNVPDIAVFYDGINDTFAAWQSGTPGIPDDEYNREREFGLLDNWEGYDSDRVVYVYRYVKYEVPVLVLQSPLGRTLKDIAKACCGRFYQLFRVSVLKGIDNPLDSMSSNESTPAGLPRKVVDYYLSNLRLVNESGKQLGFETLAYWQPTVYSREDVYPSERKYAQPWPGEEEFFVATYRYARAAANRAAVDHRLPLQDLSGALNGVGRPCFFDDLHITETCNELIAARIAADVIPLIEKRSEVQNH
jgi:lysophospholipase L1-like esterase